MISAIVLATGDGDPPDRVRERAVRSLGWLVSAVVAGVVRDVTVACPASWPVAGDMELAGCALVRADREAVRLAEAAALCKCPRLLVLRMGFQPEGPLVDEVRSLEARSDPSAPAALLQAPSTFIERLFPDRAPVVGLVLPRERLGAAGDFRHLVRGARGALRLRARLVPVL